MATTVIQSMGTKIDVDKIAEVLERAGAIAKCPFAGDDENHGDWSFAEEFVAIVPYSVRRGAIPGGSSYPVVMIACNGCGYTALFNAVMLGILDAEHSNG